MATLRWLILAAGSLAGCDAAADPTDDATADSFCGQGDLRYDNLLSTRRVAPTTNPG